MKKTNLKKYILEALGTLLVIAACLTANDICRREAYADDIEVTSITMSNERATGQYGATFNSLTKPTISEISVTNGDSDSIKSTLSIDWNEDSYNPKKTTEQTITGTVTSNDSNVKFSSSVDQVYCLVTLGAPKITSITMNAETATGGQYGSTFNSLTKPTISEISVTNGDSDSIKSTLSIDWNEDSYNPQKTTEQTITGTVKSSDGNVTFESNVNQVTCKVTLGTPQITEITLNSITATGNYGDSFSIITKPTISTISVTNGDANSIKSALSIEWSDIGYKPTQTTSQTIIGTVKSSDSNVTFGSGVDSVSCSITLSAPTVTSVTISPTSIIGKVGDKFASLDKPKITDVTLEHGNKQYVLENLSIKWNESGYSSTIENEQTISGTITSMDNNITFSSGVQVTSMKVTLISESTIEKKIKDYSENKLEEKTESSDGFSITVSDFSDDYARNLLMYLYRNGSSEVKKAIQDAAISNTTTITFTLKAKKGSPSDSHKESMEDKVENDKTGAKICDYFDLSLKLNIGNNSYAISDTGDDYSINIKITVPENSRKSTRKYNIVRYHDGSSILNSDYSELKDNEVSFSTHYFSDYGISYTDSSSSSSSSNAGSNSASVKNTIDTTASANKTSGKSPKTGDDFNPRIWIYLLIVAATIATCAGVLLHDTKDTDEAERK